ncbi:MAG: nucleotidyltransferase family protein [Pseudomonadota bacterium]|uniref:nucleotidyltransferase family protein n=1 Tax=Polaromonas sp. TaxID=1869339 RepID=UPI001850A8B8|nr:nucleotidyltransferase family protein [Polaromonas sp.]MBA3592333.1 nucleotidyltransferase family protein [Polaromonas sp.]MDQ3271997.1 nucleotidyltransferase family protein [Pseudomonadota bacterium]
MDALAQRFVQDTLRNHCNAVLLERLPELGLPDAWLVGGCLFQTVWNLLEGQPPGARIRDYDIFYFDGTDLSEATETAVNLRARQVFGGLGVQLELKNQARVHTWYPAYFGRPCPPLGNACEGVNRFLVGSTSVGLRQSGGTVQVHAPHGLEDLYRGLLRANPRVDHGPLYGSKARDYQARWPWLQLAD